MKAKIEVFTYVSPDRRQTVYQVEFSQETNLFLSLGVKEVVVVYAQEKDLEKAKAIGRAKTIEFKGVLDG